MWKAGRGVVYEAKREGKARVKAKESAPEFALGDLVALFLAAASLAALRCAFFLETRTIQKV